MISYALKCQACGHRFDGWFRSAGDFDSQAARGLVSCLACQSAKVEKALMSPAVTGSREAAEPSRPKSANLPEGGNAALSAQARALAESFARYQELSRRVRADGYDVGPRFAEEARRIHYGEIPERQIYGQASPSEVERLGEEGIVALPLAPLPEDAN